MLQLLGFIIDCPDPMKLASFYAELTSRPITNGSDNHVAAISLTSITMEG